MVNRLTVEAIKQFTAALGVGLDVGVVRPPSPERPTGSAFWRRRPLSGGEIDNLVPRLASENARGAAIFVRTVPESTDQHPGVFLLDDLDFVAVQAMGRDGLTSAAIVETSPGNFQCWIRLVAIDKSVPGLVVATIIRNLVVCYGADPRAVSPIQPGRLPGFTNRKAKHSRSDGSFPFVRLSAAAPGLVAEAAPDLIASAVRAIGKAQGGSAARPAKKQCDDQTTSTSIDALDDLWRKQTIRLQAEVAAGRRPIMASSNSEVDFAGAVAALQEGWEPDDLESWLSARRPEKGQSYGARTVAAAMRRIGSKDPCDLASAPTWK